MAELLIASVNLRGVHDRWWRREPLIVRGLASLNPDVICFQEAATWCLQARWLAWRLKRVTGARYHTRQAPKRGWRGIFEGLATSSRYSIVEHGRIGLGHGGRVSQRATLELTDAKLDVLNVHLFHRSFGGSIRSEQVKRILAWIGRETSRPSVVAGDFNDVPGSAAINEMGGGFVSAHVRAGKAEGIATSPARSPSRLIDYIFVSETVDVLDAGVFLNTSTNGVWPSDHLGLWARIGFSGPAAAVPTDSD